MARSDLSAGAQPAHDRLVEPRVCPAARAPVTRAVAVDSVKVPKGIGVEAMTGFGDRLYLAWVGHSLNPAVDWKLCLAYSPDGGEITGQQRLEQRSYGMVTRDGRPGPDPGPALAVSGEHLYLAWTGSDGRVNMLADPGSPDSTLIWLDEARSEHDPALCSHQGGLVLAWTSTDHSWQVFPLRDLAARQRGHINILTDPGSPHDPPARLDEARSCRGPALCSHQDALVLAWTDDDGYINILADPLSPHDLPARLDEARSPGGPVLCSHQGSLFFTRYGENGGRYLSRLDWA